MSVPVIKIMMMMMMMMMQVGRQQWRMARDALISGPVAWPAAVRMLHVGKYSVDTHVWIVVIPCGGDGVLVGNECCRCRDINPLQASRWLR